jgi:flagellar basal-body rod modification protein FlgD
MSTVGSVTTLAPSSSTSTTGNASASLTQQDFLKLMVAQFQAQDPLASDSGSGGSGSGSGAADYVNQLMSMTNLTTMQTMSAQQSLLLASSLPGATVTVTKPDNTTATGTVTGTTIDSTGLKVLVNGDPYPFTEITALTPAAAASSTPGAGTSTTSN